LNLPRVVDDQKMSRFGQRNGGCHETDNPCHAAHLASALRSRRYSFPQYPALNESYMARVLTTLMETFPAVASLQ
jgi:hypothetical protein